MPAPNQKQVTDEEEAEQMESRLTELLGKDTRSPDEEKEVGELKEKRHGRFQKKIDKATWETKAEREARIAAEERAAKAEAELEKLRAKGNTAPDPISQTVDIDGKTWYTDEALQSMVDLKRMTEDQAWDHKRKRERAEIKSEVLTEVRQNTEQVNQQQTRDDDMKAVLEKYPHFHKSHPKFNPDDPLYAEAARIYNNGYKFDPRGMSKAIAEAQKILGTDRSEHVDLSDQFNVGSSGPGGNRQVVKKAEDKVELNQFEKEHAVKMWCDLENPVTRKNYTEAEAMEKAKKAKASRLTRRS